MSKDISKVVNETLYELNNYPDRSMSFRVKNNLKKLLKRDYVSMEVMNWPKGMLLRGLVDYCNASCNASLNTPLTSKVNEEIKKYIDSWIDNGEELFVIDDAIAAEALFYLYKETGEEKYKKSIEKVYGFLCDSRKDEKGSKVYRPSQKNEYIIADMIGMICPFMSLYGKYFDKKEAFDIVQNQIINFLDMGFDDITGLPYHGYELKVGCHGIIGWGRAVGWILSGMSFYLALNMDTTTMEYKKIHLAYVEFVETILKYVRTDNTFSWQLEATKGHKDISGSAMIVNSLQRFNLREDNSFIVSDSTIASLVSGIEESIVEGKVKDTLSECPGFSMHPQVFGNYPWGQGSVLSVLAGFIE